jgi:hypothetical protein
MNLLEDDGAKIISMITEGKIQAAEEEEDSSKKEMNESLQKEITQGKLEAAGMKRIYKAEGGSLLADDMAMITKKTCQQKKHT